MKQLFFTILGSPVMQDVHCVDSLLDETFFESILTSQKTHRVSIMKVTRLIVFKGMNSIYSGNWKNSSYTFRGRNAVLFNLLATDFFSFKF